MRGAAARPVQCRDLLKELHSVKEFSFDSPLADLFTETFCDLNVLQQSFWASGKKSCEAEKDEEEDEKERDEKEVTEKSEMEATEKDPHHHGCSLSPEDMEGLSSLELALKITFKVASSLDMEGLKNLFHEREQLMKGSRLLWASVNWATFLSKISSLWNVVTYANVEESKRDIAMTRSLYLSIWVLAMLEFPLMKYAKGVMSYLFNKPVSLPTYIEAALCLLWRNQTSDPEFLQTMLRSSLQLGQNLLLKKLKLNETSDLFSRQYPCPTLSLKKIKQQLYCLPSSSELQSVLQFLQLLHAASIFCGRWKYGAHFDKATQKRAQEGVSQNGLVFHFGSCIPLLQVLGVCDTRDCLEPLLGTEEFCIAPLTEMLESLMQDGENPMRKATWWKPPTEKYRPPQSESCELRTQAGPSYGSSSMRPSCSLTADSEEELEQDEEATMSLNFGKEDKTVNELSFIQLLHYPYLLCMELRVQFLQIRANLLRKSRRAQHSLPRHYLHAAAMLHSLLTENEFGMGPLSSLQRRAPATVEHEARTRVTTESTSSHATDAAGSSSTSSLPSQPTSTSQSNLPENRDSFLNLLDPSSRSSSSGALENSSSTPSSFQVAPLLNLQDSHSSSDIAPRHRLLHLLSQYHLSHFHGNNSSDHGVEWDTTSSEEDSDSGEEGSMGFSEFHTRVRLHPLRVHPLHRLLNVSSPRQGVNILNRNSRANSAVPRHWNLVIERDRITESFLTQLNTLLESQSRQVLSRPLRIQFSGEPGMDQGGGLTKEFFHLIFSQMFQPEYGLFTWHGDSGVYWITCYEEPLSEHLVEYKYVGILIALCVYHAIPINVSLPTVFFHKLLGKSGSRLHLSEVYRDLYRGLDAMLNYEDEDVAFEAIYSQTFQVSQQDTFGCIFHYELIPQGSDIPVTVSNAHEFVDAYADYLLNKSVESQFRELQEGWNLVLEAKHYEHLLLPHEFRRILYHQESVCVESLRKHTIYSDCYHESHPNISAFWNVVRYRLTAEEHVGLLQFVTASKRLPLGGYRKLKFTIVPAGGEDDRPPSAHTCFNTLILPNYTSEDKLLKHLRMAIQYNEGFGLT